MAKPNYQYEKRQRELEKKKKKENKALKKAASAEGTPSDDNIEQTPQEATPASPDGELPAA